MTRSRTSGAAAGRDGEIAATAPAKVNLYLHVLGRRGDGRHAVDTLIAFADVADSVRVRPARGLSLEITGPFAPALRGPVHCNLVLRAARALADAADVSRGAAIVLDKRLPVAAGLGSGSADAAAALRALTRLWRIDRRTAALRPLAARLGTDVPACLVGGAMRASGAGERLHPLPPLPRPLPLVLANPGSALPTGEVFAGLRPPFSAPAPWPAGRGDAAALVRELARRRNDLEAPARRLAPAVGCVLEALAATPRCLLARMSGSGATCFAIYPTAARARAAARLLRRRHVEWWVRTAVLASR